MERTFRLSARLGIGMGRKLLDQAENMIGSQSTEPMNAQEKFRAFEDMLLKNIRLFEAVPELAVALAPWHRMLGRDADAYTGTPNVKSDKTMAVDFASVLSEGHRMDSRVAGPIANETYEQARGGEAFDPDMAEVSDRPWRETSPSAGED